MIWDEFKGRVDAVLNEFEAYMKRGQAGEGLTATCASERTEERPPTGEDVPGPQ